MTFEDYLKTKLKMTRDEIRAVNAEYIGSYLYNILKPEATKKLSADRVKELSLGQLKKCVELLYQKEAIDEVEFLELLDLPNIPFIPQSKEDTKQKVRDLLKTTKPDWLKKV